MRKLFCTLVLAGLLLSAPVLRAQEVQILMTGGTFHRGEVTAESGQIWFGLFPDGQEFRLVRTTIQVTPARDEIIGDNEDEKTGKLVTCDQPGKPLFLVRGIPGLNHRPVETAWQGARFFYPGECDSYFFSGTHTGIMAFGEAVKTEHYSGFYFRNYSLILTKGREERPLVHFENLSPDVRPHLIWVGDLDNDGKMDMLWNLTEWYFASRYTLFLSSLASGNEWLLKAAQFVHTSD